MPWPVPREPSSSPHLRARGSAPPQGIEKPGTSSKLSSSISQSLGQLQRTEYRRGTPNTEGTARSLRPESSIHTHWGHALRCRPSPCATGAAQSKKTTGAAAHAPPGWRAKYRPHPQGCASSQAAYASGPYRWGPRTSWQWVRVLAESLLTRRWGSPCSACLGRGD